MIDHVSIRCSDLSLSRKFFADALAPLGYGELMAFGENVGIGAKGKPDLWLTPGTPSTPPNHLAFVAADRATVKAFHKAALKAGGKDDGKPGLRKHYHPNYYGAFVRDPDGYSVEVVCHGPEAAQRPLAGASPAAKKTKPTPASKRNVLKAALTRKRK